MISRASSRRRTGSPKSFVVIGRRPAASTRRVEPLQQGLSRAGVRLHPAWCGSTRAGSRGTVPHGGGGVVHGLLDVGVAGAPAEVAADHVVDLVLGQIDGVVPLLQAGG